MKIARLETWTETIPVARPYSVAFRTTSHADLGFVRAIGTDGVAGFGCAAPVEEITGESFAATSGALARAAAFAGDAALVLEQAERELAATPAARAAIDMAVHDLAARRRGLPLVDALGRVHRPLPTSVTIGIRSLADTLAEAREYLERGFRVIKVKIGEDRDGDIERLLRLRELVGADVALRADANIGYAPADLAMFFARTAAVGLEFLEQPSPRDHDDAIRALPAAIRARLCADESLHGEADAERLLTEPRPFGIWNIKLAKCGGVSAALRIARRAAAHGIAIMWGCMDESVVSIAAALHAAYASPATRFLDLDGAFDLARDPFAGGVAVTAGTMHVLAAPGLGATPAPR